MIRTEMTGTTLGPENYPQVLQGVAHKQAAPPALGFKIFSLRKFLNLLSIQKKQGHFPESE